MNKQRLIKFLFLVSSCLTLLTPGVTQAQKKPFSERVGFSIGTGISELKMTFGTNPNQWTTRFSYRFSLGYALSEQVALGISFNIIELSASNAVYLPAPPGLVISKQATKGENCSYGGLFIKIIPVKNFNRLSLQLDGPIGGYRLIDDDQYSGTGTGFGLTIAYNVLKGLPTRLEPYFSYAWANLQDRHANGQLLTGRSFQTFSLGVQLFLRK